MIRQYVDAALRRANYEIIDDEQPFYGEVTDLPGVWASGRTLEECRTNLSETIEGWILVRVHITWTRHYLSQRTKPDKGPLQSGN